MMIKTETLDASIGRRVIAARKASECSEMEAAACLNLAEADYCAREAGRTQFRSREIAALAELFSVEVRSLFEDSDPAADRAAARADIALADWIKASRQREGLNAVLQSTRNAALDALQAEAA